MKATVYKTSIERIDSLSYNVKSFRLKLIDPPSISFEAGQFITASIPKDGTVVKRAYSIASSPYEEGIIELCIQHVERGIASSFFWNSKEGTLISISGPHGRFGFKQPIDYQPVLISTGTGVAPFRSMLHHLFHINVSQEIWLLAGHRYEHSILYDDEFRAMAAARKNFHYIPTISRPKEWAGETGHVQQTFKKYITDYSNKEFYVCGRNENVKSIVSELTLLGVEKNKLHIEEW